MQFSSSVLIAVLSALTSTAAASPSAKSALKVDFQVKKTNKPRSGNGFLSRVAKSGVLLELENQYAMYIAEIEIGTPPQKILTDVDTGSSDLWVPGAGTQSDYGTYSHNASSTYQKVADGFAIGYGDGSEATGSWARETVSLGGIKVTDFMFGDATKQTAGESVFGIGLSGLEASNGGKNGFTYANFPVQLKNQGQINKVGYSLYLNSLEAESGSVLFGAIDHAKYEGDMKTLDLVAMDDSGAKIDKPIAFFVDLNSISDDGTTHTNETYPALLDSGTTLIYAPPAVYKSIGSKYGKFDNEVGGYLTSCSTKGEDFKFTFEDKTVTVPFSNMLFKVDDEGKDCIVAVQESDSDMYILGDAFLRSAYIYYDLEALQVQIAQVKYTNQTAIELVQ